MKETILLVVDVQNGLVDAKPFAGDTVIANIGILEKKCRAAGVEVAFVQHDGRPGDELEPGAWGWEIHRDVAPARGEQIFRKKFNSAFKETDLKAYFDQKNVGTIILVGMQTEYCIDTTCRVAFELGYQIIIPDMTNTTFDNGELSAAQVYQYHNQRLFKNRFATVVPLEDALEMIEKIGRLN